jgi:hypothetical protein
VRRPWWGGLALLAVVVVAACSGDDGGPGTLLPPAAGHDPAVTYRIVYRVTTPDGSATEERQVRRPFDAHVILRDGGGTVTAERWSSLGALVTRTPGSDVAGLSVAVAPALSDLRIDRFGTELTAAQRLTKGRSSTVGGRACTYYAEEGTAAALPTDAQPGLGEAKPIYTVIDRCVDAQDIVLEERWSSPGGERLLTKRATSLELGDDAELDLDAPRAEPMTAAQGNGAFQTIDPDTPPPFAERFTLPAPDGFRSLGRFAVVPPRLGSKAAVGDAQLAFYSDVWTRGADLLLLDQGAGTNGATPFDDALVWRPLTLPELGPAELAGTPRMAEVRLHRPDGGFVRLAGTVPVDELIELAGTLRLDGAPS